MKILSIILFALIIASISSGLVFGTGVAAPSTQSSSAEQITVRFDMLQLTDTLLRGPYGTMRVRFGLPPNWGFQEGASLKLIMTASLITDASQTIADRQFIGSTLTVTLNRNAIATIPILAGSNIAYDIPIPSSALTSPSSDGRHELSLFLDAGNDCSDTTRQTSLVISSASHFTLPYTEQAPAIDLTRLPRPIYQRDTIFPVRTILVVPDQPSPQELQAALIVSASFGRMTGGNMDLTLFPMSGLTQALGTDSELIFVGKASTLSLFQGVPLPSPLKNKAFDVSGMQADDGVLQMAISPWNMGRVLLVVSGNSDAGVIKAAQALSNGNIQTLGDHNLALVANVIAVSGSGSNDGNIVPQETRTFRDLGYDILTLSGVGRSDVVVRFALPPGFIAADDTYLDLTFNHSSLLDFNRSGLTIFMNGNLVGSVLLSQQTAATTTQRIKFPPSSLVTSNNELRFQSDLAPLTQCSFLDFSNLWLTILPESVLHMPIKPVAASLEAMQDLSVYPQLFASEPTLSNLAFVVQKDDPSTWEIASRLAFQLARPAAGSLFNLEAAFDENIPDDIRTNRDLIVIGLPSKMQIIKQMKDALPAPFEEGTNVAVVENQQVLYRFPADASLGFIELLTSPWNQDRMILAVVGTNQSGVQQSGLALTGLLRSSLKGNFVLVNGETITVADTRTGLGLAGFNSNENAVAQLPAANSGTPVPDLSRSGLTSTMSWIPWAIFGLLVAIGLVIFVAAYTRRRAVMH